MASARSLTDLPEEMLIHVAARVAASFKNPMDDLRHLRGACSHMRDKVCGAALVHRSLNLRLVLQQSVDAAISERLIVNTHGAGNLEALFIMGMRVTFRQHSGATSRWRTCSLCSCGEQIVAPSTTSGPRSS